MPEPSNLYDPNAVKVMHDLSLIGYIPRAKAERFSVDIDSGCIVTASILTGRDKGTLGVVLRVRVEDPEDDDEDDDDKDRSYDD